MPHVEQMLIKNAKYFSPVGEKALDSGPLQPRGQGTAGCSGSGSRQFPVRTGLHRYRFAPVSVNWLAGSRQFGPFPVPTGSGSHRFRFPPVPVRVGLRFQPFLVDAGSRRFGLYRLLLIGFSVNRNISA